MTSLRPRWRRKSGDKEAYCKQQGHLLCQELGSHLLTTGLPNPLAVGMLSDCSHRAKPPRSVYVAHQALCKKSIGRCIQSPQRRHAKASVRITWRVGWGTLYGPTCCISSGHERCIPILPNRTKRLSLLTSLLGDIK